ncbi:MAG: hypothetical protein RR222_17360, partial [Pseudomonas sp.]|uniref:hypothetical protein n=1 Tax=Pseudomonas sp. TaxID=306 RepID=UPI002FC8B586
MKVFQKVFQQKNKPDIFLTNQFVMNPVQITPAHQPHTKPRLFEVLCLLTFPKITIRRDTPTNHPHHSNSQSISQPT